MFINKDKFGFEILSKEPNFIFTFLVRSEIAFISFNSIGKVAPKTTFLLHRYKNRTSYLFPQVTCYYCNTFDSTDHNQEQRVGGGDSQREWSGGL